MELRKKLLIVGGGNGNRFATAKLLVQEGCTVTIWDINQSELEKAKSELERLGKVFYSRVTDKTEFANGSTSFE